MHCILVHDGRRLESRRQRPACVARNHADDDVAERAIERLGRAAGPRVEREQRPALRLRDLLERNHQRPGDPLPTRGRVHEQLQHFRPVLLVGRHR